MSVQERTPEWVKDGACRDAPEELFHAAPYSDEEAEAKQICRSCSYTTECLAWVLDSENRHGIVVDGRLQIFRAGVYGGTTPIERADLNRSQTLDA